MGYNLYHDLLIKASREQVFRTVTDPVKLMNWWPQKCSGKPELGAEYNFYFTEEYDWLAEVIEYEEDSVITYKMTRADEDWNPTQFSFKLAEHRSGIMMMFSHENWPKLNHHFRKSNWHWALLLKGLKDYVEKGIIIPFEYRA